MQSVWSMGEIDTKSIESVQAALCYFGEKTELRKPYREPDSDTQQKDLDELQKELANYKVQLEAKGSENLQALLNLQHYQKTIRELSSKLEECEAARDLYIVNSKIQVQKLETEMADQLSEASKLKEQLRQVTELISLRNQMVQDLEHQLLSNSLFIESLQSELQQAIEMSSCSEAVADDLKAKLEDEERRSSKQALYIESLNIDHGLLNIELKNANEDTELLKSQLENLTEELDSVKLKLTETENVLHRENTVAIADDEYQQLLAAKAEGDDLRNEVEMLKKEQESDKLKVSELKTRAEQAVSRAESAERAKLAVEGQLRKWREQKQNRSAAKSALKQLIHDDNERPVSKHQPLGKVLNMKF